MTSINVVKITAEDKKCYAAFEDLGNQFEYVETKWKNLSKLNF